MWYTPSSRRVSPRQSIRKYAHLNRKKMRGIMSFCMYERDKWLLTTNYFQFQHLGSPKCSLHEYDSLLLVLAHLFVNCTKSTASQRNWLRKKNGTANTSNLRKQTQLCDQDRCCVQVSIGSTIEWTHWRMKFWASEANKKNAKCRRADFRKDYLGRMNSS